MRALDSEGEEYFTASLRWLVSLALCLCIVISFGWPFLSSLVLVVMWCFVAWMIMGFFLFRQVWKQVRLAPFFWTTSWEIIPRKKSTLSLQDFLDDPSLDVYSDMLLASQGTWGDNPPKCMVSKHLFPLRTEMKLPWSFHQWLVGEVAYCRFHPDFVTGYYWILLANIRHRGNQPLVETVVPMVVKYIEVCCGWNIGPGKWWSKLGRSRVLYQGTPLEMTS